MTERLLTLAPARTPLLINVPHAGTYIPSHLRDRLTPIANTVPDTDWHVHLLYQVAVEAGAGLMVATHSRYVVDLNRDPDDRPLYPGADNTELCPTSTFDREPIYRDAGRLEAEEIMRRRDIFWAPYHAELQRELKRIHDAHGRAVLLDAHSIRSHVPRFFAGKLPDLNLGTADGRSCARELETAAMHTLAASHGFTSILNGRFKGGYITRRYGEPAARLDALQLEIAQSCYMDEAPPFAWEVERARPLMSVLERLVAALIRGA
jgi:N-formylglutamate deformylase